MDNLAEVFKYGQVGKEVVALKNHSDLGPNLLDVQAI
jgi:hypothetical protein